MMIVGVFAVSIGEVSSSHSTTMIEMAMTVCILKHGVEQKHTHNNSSVQHLRAQTVAASLLLP